MTSKFTAAIAAVSLIAALATGHLDIHRERHHPHRPVAAAAAVAV